MKKEKENQRGYFFNEKPFIFQDIEKVQNVENTCSKCTTKKETDQTKFLGEKKKQTTKVLQRFTRIQLFLRKAIDREILRQSKDQENRKFEKGEKG